MVAKLDIDSFTVPAKAVIDVSSLRAHLSVIAHLQNTITDVCARRLLTSSTAFAGTMKEPVSLGPDNFWAAGWGLRRFGAVPLVIVKAVVMGAGHAISVLDADWSVIAKFERIFDLMSINELYLSVPTTVITSNVCTTRSLTAIVCLWHSART